MKECPLVSLIPTAGSTPPRAPKVGLGFLRGVEGACLGHGFIQGTDVSQAPQNELMAPVVFLTFLPFQPLLSGLILLY